MFPSRSLVSGLKAMQLSILRPQPPHRLRRHFSPSTRPQAEVLREEKRALEKKVRMFDDAHEHAVRLAPDTRFVPQSYLKLNP